MTVSDRKSRNKKPKDLYSEFLYSEYSDKYFELIIALFRARDTILIAYEKESNRQGLSYEEIRTMFFVKSIGPEATISEVARRTIRRPNSVFYIVDRMVNKGLLIKTKDIDRRNITRIAVTDKGEQLFRLKRYSFQNMVSNLTDKERAILISLCNKLYIKALNESGEKHWYPPIEDLLLHYENGNKHEETLYSGYSDKANEVRIALFRARDTMLLAWEKECASHGLTYEEARTIFFIKSIGRAATITEVARRTIRRPNSVFYIANRMVKRGLLKKTKDLKQKNLTRVTLTDKGEELFRLTTKRKSIRHMVSGLSDEERILLTSLCNKLYIEALRESGEKHWYPPIEDLLII
jgi:DNA-binding MarR family transcriptional regulator